MKLETLKICIENNLINDFIGPSKFFIKAYILFVKNSDESFWLSVNYQYLYNLIMKNQ